MTSWVHSLLFIASEKVSAYLGKLLCTDHLTAHGSCNVGPIFNYVSVSPEISNNFGQYSVSMTDRRTFGAIKINSSNIMAD